MDLNHMKIKMNRQVYKDFFGVYPEEHGFPLTTDGDKAIVDQIDQILTRFDTPSGIWKRKRDGKNVHVKFVIRDVVYYTHGWPVRKARMKLERFVREFEKAPVKNE